MTPSSSPVRIAGFHPVNAGSNPAGVTMANHKRRKPKHQRAGCLLCKPHKDERRAKQNRKGERRGDWRRRMECKG